MQHHGQRPSLPIHEGPEPTDPMNAKGELQLVEGVDGDLTPCQGQELLCDPPGVVGPKLRVARGNESTVHPKTGTTWNLEVNVGRTGLLAVLQDLPYCLVIVSHRSSRQVDAQGGAPLTHPSGSGCGPEAQSTRSAEGKVTKSDRTS